MQRFDYPTLKQQMEQIGQIAAERPEELAGAVSDFLSGQDKLPPECSDVIFWILSCDLEADKVVRCFDWYTLDDVYHMLAVNHENMPEVLREYLRRHPVVESENLADYLWFAALYHLGAQNAWQLAYADRLELFRAFVENMTVYAMHTVRAEAWNNEDIYLLAPELRLTYHVNQAYASLEDNDLDRYAHYLNLAAEDCPDLQSCLDALKALPSRTTQSLAGMAQDELQRYALQLIAEIKRTFQSEDWLKTAELVKKFDWDGFDPGLDFELLGIRCQLAERGLLW